MFLVPAMDRLGHIIHTYFPDSIIAQAYSQAHIKASCILNRAISPDAQAKLVKLMQTLFYILVTGRNDDQNLEKENPVTVNIFDKNQQKIVTQFFDMCLSRTATAFKLLKVLLKYEIPREIVCHLVLTTL